MLQSMGSQRVGHDSVTELCPTLRDPVGCALPAPSVHRVSRGGPLEWVAISFSQPTAAPVLSSWSAKHVDSNSVEKKLPLVPWHQPPKCPSRSEPDTETTTAEPREKGAPVSHHTRG